MCQAMDKHGAYYIKNYETLPINAMHLEEALFSFLDAVAVSK